MTGSRVRRNDIDAVCVIDGMPKAQETAQPERLLKLLCR